MMPSEIFHNSISDDVIPAKISDAVLIFGIPEVVVILWGSTQVMKFFDFDYKYDEMYAILERLQSEY